MGRNKALYGQKSDSCFKKWHEMGNRRNIQWQKTRGRLPSVSEFPRFGFRPITDFAEKYFGMLLHQWITDWKGADSQLWIMHTIPYFHQNSMEIRFSVHKVKTFYKTVKTCFIMINCILLVQFQQNRSVQSDRNVQRFYITCTKWSIKIQNSIKYNTILVKILRALFKETEFRFCEWNKLC